jgi:hypothetical protein
MECGGIPGMVFITWNGMRLHEMGWNWIGFDGMGMDFTEWDGLHEMG